jgi:hypothetical protein
MPRSGFESGIGAPDQGASSSTARTPDLFVCFRRPSQAQGFPGVQASWISINSRLSRKSR